MKKKTTNNPKTANGDLPAVGKRFPIIESKTKTCYWCKKIKPTEQTYYITNKGKRQIRICVDCNLKVEVV